MESCSRYTLREEVANAATHGIGTALAVVGLVILVMVAAGTGGALRVTAASVFGGTMVLLYLVSTLYHALSTDRAKRVFKVLDHAAIYLLIAGTYTPFALVGLGGTLGWILFATVWTLAAVGVAISAVALHRTRVLAMVLYLGMGWCILGAAGPMLHALGGTTMGLILAGGVAYTSGLAFYGWHRLPYAHAFWHLFVLAGSLLHWIAVVRVIS